MPYVQLPWLNFDPMTFLSALDRGTQAGATPAMSAQESSRPRGYIGGGMFDPLEQARANAINQKTAQESAEAKDKTAADAERKRLISIGVSPDEAAAQSGFDKYMKPGAASSPWQTLNLGQGEVVRVNRKTGESDTVQGPREKADPAKLAKMKSLRSELITLDRLLANPVTAVVSGQQIQSEKNAKQAELAELEKELGMASGDPAGQTNQTESAPYSAPWGGQFNFQTPTASGFRILNVE